MFFFKLYKQLLFFLRYYEPFIPRKLDACFCRKTAMWQTQSEKQFINSHETVVSVYKNNTPCRLPCHLFKIC